MWDDTTERVQTYTRRSGIETTIPVLMWPTSMASTVLMISNTNYVEYKSDSHKCEVAVK
jgi:hypothetical protein